MTPSDIVIIAIGIAVILVGAYLMIQAAVYVGKMYDSYEERDD